MYTYAVPDPPFRSPKCGGQVVQNQTITLGCVPLRPAVMQDFQDFINFLAGLPWLPTLALQHCGIFWVIS